MKPDDPKFEETWLTVNHAQWDALLQACRFIDADCFRDAPELVEAAATWVKVLQGPYDAKILLGRPYEERRLLNEIVGEFVQYEAEMGYARLDVEPWPRGTGVPETDDPERAATASWAEWTLGLLVYDKHAQVTS